MFLVRPHYISPEKFRLPNRADYGKLGGGVVVVGDGMSYSFCNSEEIE